MAPTNKVANLKVVKKDKETSKVSALSPREIVSELDRYVIGQKAVSYTHLTLPTKLSV